MKNLKRKLKDALVVQILTWLEYQPRDKVQAACLCFVDQLSRETAA